MISEERIEELSLEYTGYDSVKSLIRQAAEESADAEQKRLEQKLADALRNWHLEFQSHAVTKAILREADVFLRRSYSHTEPKKGCPLCELRERIADTLKPAQTGWVLGDDCVICQNCGLRAIATGRQTDAELAVKTKGTP